VVAGVLMVPIMLMGNPLFLLYKWVRSKFCKEDMDILKEDDILF
jgi:hypothetical protein